MDECNHQHSMFTICRSFPYVVLRTRINAFYVTLLHSIFPLQCFDTVDWVTGRASGLKKTGCWFVGGDDLTGALHVL